MNLPQAKLNNAHHRTPEPSSILRDGQVIRDLKKVSTQLPDPLVCLTFDDGPDPVYTPLILDLLAEHKVHATFFIVGESAQKYPHLVERMVSDGHALGNHTFHHHHPWTISAARARDEVMRTSDIIRALTGITPQWFRPPHGRLRKAMLEQCATLNLRTVLWNRSIIDWGPLGTTDGITKRLESIAAGDIVLMHDGQRKHNRPHLVAQCLPEALDSLRRRGIVPVTLDQVAHNL
jgi:peptidoglycan/xylan/chitin deacetylase (PgdA/CDA1 family)